MTDRLVEELKPTKNVAKAKELSRENIHHGAPTGDTKFYPPSMSK
jgi:hypothetical protein